MNHQEKGECTLLLTLCLFTETWHITLTRKQQLCVYQRDQGNNDSETNTLPFNFLPFVKLWRSTMLGICSSYYWLKSSASKTWHRIWQWWKAWNTKMEWNRNRSIILHWPSCPQTNQYRITYKRTMQLGIIALNIMKWSVTWPTKQPNLVTHVKLECSICQMQKRVVFNNYKRVSLKNMCILNLIHTLSKFPMRVLLSGMNR